MRTEGEIRRNLIQETAFNVGEWDRGYRRALEWVLENPKPLPKGILYFPTTNVVAQWSENMKAYAVTGTTDVYGDPNELLEGYGYDYEVLKENV